MPVPVEAVEPVLEEVARDQADAILAEGVRSRVQELERYALARALEVREDEREEQGDGAEPIAVLYRQFVPTPELHPQRLHLRGRLDRGTFGQPRHPEHDRVRDGLIVTDLPALQVAEVVVAGAGLGRMRFEREARARKPDDRTLVADRRGVDAPGGDLRRDLRKPDARLLIGKRHRQQKRADALHEPQGEPLDHLEVARIRERRPLSVTHLAPEMSNCVERNTRLAHLAHAVLPSLSGKLLLTDMAKRKSGTYSRPSFENRKTPKTRPGTPFKKHILLYHTFAKLSSGRYNRAMYVFLDESGKPETYSRRGVNLVAAGHASKFLVITAVRTDDHLAIQKAVTEERLSILKDPLLASKFSPVYSLNTFHAQTDYSEVKRQFYRWIQSCALDLKIAVIVADKQKVYPHLQRDPGRLYAMIAGQLLKRFLHSGESIEVIFSRRDASLKARERLQLVVDTLRIEFASQHQFESKTHIAYHHNPHYTHGGLQVADYIAHAVFQVVERGKRQWYEIIKDRIGYIQDIFNKKSYARGNPL